MILTIEKKDKNHTIITSNPLDMGVLFDFLEEYGLVMALQKSIEEDIKNKAYSDFTFNSTGIKVKGDNFIIYDLFSGEDDEDYYPEEHGFEVPQQALWKLLEEYDKAVDTSWKKMEISFDGKEFELKVE